MIPWLVVSCVLGGVFGWYGAKWGFTYWKVLTSYMVVYTLLYWLFK